MGERERKQYYRDRNEGRYRESSPPYRRGEGSDWDRDVDYTPWRAQNETERNDRGYGEYGPRNYSERNYEYDRDYGQRGYRERDYGRSFGDYGPRSYGDYERRGYGERDYGERGYGDYGPRNYGSSQWRVRDAYGERGTGSYSPSRFPGTFGSYEDQVSARDYGRRYGSESNYDYRERDIYRPTWGEDYDHDYGQRGRERGRSEHGVGQQLREAGQRVVRSVKRAFRGPKGYKRSDERIREDVNDRLSQQDDLDPTEIEVSVSNAEVTLTGFVRSRQEKFIAEEIADDVSGVTEVHNQLRVRREQVQSAPASSEATSAAGAQAVTEAARNRNARA